MKTPEAITGWERTHAGTGASRPLGLSDAARARRRVLAALLGLALGVLLGLLYAPNSRWLLREQASIPLPGLAAPGPEIVPSMLESSPAESAERALRRAALARPEDAAAQAAIIARAVYMQEPGTPVRSAMAGIPLLVQRFPDAPEAYAVSLRLMAARTVRIGGPAPARADDLAAFDRYAARGEAVDPQNAFFPAMRAAGHFAAGRDREALAALARAARKPVYRDHLPEEAHGAWRLSDAAFGYGNPTARGAMVAAMALPYNRLLLNTGNRAAADAFRAEGAGHLAEGYAIRRDLMLLGARMRSQSSSLIGTFTGIALQESAARADAPGREHLTAAQREAFAAYLRRAGHPEAVARAEQQWRSSAAVRRIASEGLERYDVLRGLEPFGRWLLVGSGALAAAVWLGFCALAAAWADRRSPGDRSARLAWAVLALIALPVVATALAAPAPEMPGVTHRLIIGMLLCALSAPLVIVAALGLAARAQRAPAAPFLRRHFGTSAMAAACLLILAHGGLTLQTLRIATSVNRSMDRLVSHEGRFYANLLATPWPQ